MGLILAKVSDMRISIPFDLSSRSLTTDRLLGLVDSNKGFGSDEF